MGAGEVPSQLKLSVDCVDDAEFDLASARLEDGCFKLDGEIDWLQSLSLVVKNAKDQRRLIRRLRRQIGRRALKTSRSPVQLVIEGVARFEINDESQTGVLILEDYLVSTRGILLRGVIPCDVLVEGPATSAPFVLVGTETGGRPLGSVSRRKES